MTGRPLVSNLFDEGSPRSSKAMELLSAYRHVGIFPLAPVPLRFKEIKDPYNSSAQLAHIRNLMTIKPE